MISYLFFLLVLPACLFYIVDSFREKTEKLSACCTYIDTFSSAHSVLEEKYALLKRMKSIVKEDVVVGRDGLPRLLSPERDWGFPFTVYKTPTGRKLHTLYGCNGAHEARHLYTLKAEELSEENFCSRCRHLLPGKILSFLMLYRECELHLGRMGFACRFLEKSILQCDKGIMRLWRYCKIKKYKKELLHMRTEKDAMQSKLSIMFRKGYLGLEGAEFYRVCFSHTSPAGTNPEAPFIAALRPVPKVGEPVGTSYHILRLGFPKGGFVVYDNNTPLIRGKEHKLLGFEKEEKYAHYVYLAEDSLNLLPSSFQ